MEGYYYDPLHGACLRSIERIAPNTYFVRGVYGSDEPQTGTPWYAHMYRGENQTLSVDFSKGKPIKKDPVLTATYDPVKRAIKWCDGNTWQQLFHHVSQFPCKKITCNAQRSSNDVRA